MTSLFTQPVIVASAIAAVCGYFIVQYRMKSNGSVKKNEIASVMMDEMMQNGITYDMVKNIDNIRTADPIQTPELDTINFRKDTGGNIMEFQNRMVDNIKNAYQMPLTTADQASNGFYVPSQQELDQSERYVRDY